MKSSGSAAERHSFIEGSENTIYLKLLLWCFQYIFFFKGFIPWCCLTGEKGVWREYRLYIVVKTGRLEWKANSFSCLLCGARWMSAIDMSFPLKQILISLSASKETVCRHGGDRQEGVGSVLCDSIFCTAQQYFFGPWWHFGLFLVICTVSNSVAEKAGRELVGAAGCKPHLRLRRPLPRFISYACINPLCYYHKMQFCCPRLGISSFKWQISSWLLLKLYGNFHWASIKKRRWDAFGGNLRLLRLLCSTQKCGFWYASSLLCKWFGKKSLMVIYHDISMTVTSFSYAI